MLYRLNRLAGLIAIGLLTGCTYKPSAPDIQQSPCPHFGATCHTIPVNRWDDTPYTDS